MLRHDYQDFIKVIDYHMTFEFIGECPDRSLMEDLPNLLAACHEILNFNVCPAMAFYIWGDYSNHMATSWMIKPDSESIRTLLFEWNKNYGYLSEIDVLRVLVTQPNRHPFNAFFGSLQYEHEKIIEDCHTVLTPLQKNYVSISAYRQGCTSKLLSDRINYFIDIILKEYAWDSTIPKDSWLEQKTKDLVSIKEKGYIDED